MAKETYVYHIIREEDWNKSSLLGFYSPTSLKEEGFIHFSYAKQIPGVVQRFYQNIERLLILKIDTRKLNAKLFDDYVEGVDVFPHLYGELNLDAVAGSYSLKMNEDNQVFWIEE